jgi:hypothetical protein
VVAQVWIEMAKAPTGMYSHLATAALAAARALLLADMGSVRDVRIATSEYVIVVQRIGRADRSGFIVAVVPVSSDLDAVTVVLREHTPALLDTLR